MNEIGEEELFSFHMAQHLLIGDLAPLCLLAGLTGPLLRPLLALPGVMRLRVLANPFVALPVWAVNLVLWHVPALYEGAVEHSALHALEHISFFVAGIAETNRPPFDLPEAEQELVAGYHTEYSGMRFGLYSTAEYINMITLSGLAVTLFFGGWGGPWLPGPIWFLLKLGAFLFVFIWLRATLPRLRYDQLMRFGWKVLLPVATLNALVTAILVALV